MNALVSYLHVRAVAVRRLLDRMLGQEGQGTVEYVGLILLVSMLMVALVAAMKGFHTSAGQDLAELIVTKIKAAVNALTFH